MKDRRLGIECWEVDVLVGMCYWEGNAGNQGAHLQESRH